MAIARQREVGTPVDASVFEEAQLRHTQRYDAARFLRGFLQVDALPEALQMPTEGINPETEMLDLLNGASIVRHQEEGFQERVFTEQGLPRVSVLIYQDTAATQVMHVIAEPINLQESTRGSHAIFGYDPEMGDWQLVEDDAAYLPPQELQANYMRQDGLKPAFQVIYNPPLYLVQ